MHDCALAVTLAKAGCVQQDTLLGSCMRAAGILRAFALLAFLWKRIEVSSDTTVRNGRVGAVYVLLRPN